MSLPNLQVLVGFNTTAGFGQPFQLNDAVYGLLDTGTLGGIAFADLTTYVQSVNITRGRSRQLQEFNAGTATVSFYNKSRVLDPLNTASVYWNTSANTTGVIPRLPIIIKVNGQAIYTGTIIDWNLEYDLANNDMMYATCSDNFTILASTTLNYHTVIEESSSARILTVLNYPEVAYQGQRAIGSGSSTLGLTASNAGFSIDEGTALLNYLQTISTSEQGYLYMSRDGTLTFKGRSETLNRISSVVFSGDKTVPTNIPYKTLDNQYGDELLFNVIVTQSPAGGPYSVQDDTSISQYQVQTFSLTSLLNSSTTELQAMGNYLLGKYKQPELRFTGVSIQTIGMTDNQILDFITLDLTDVCSVTKHFVTGSPTSTTQTLLVSGISHNITPGSHIITYTFESTDSNQYLTLDSAVFGILDQNLLAF